MSKKIELSLNENGELVMSDKGYSARGNFIERKLEWQIKGSDISGFKIEGKHDAGPFDEPLSSEFVDKQKATVSFLTHPREWEYCVIWKDRNGTHTKDPKIAVKSFSDQEFARIILLAVVTVISYLFFYKKKKAWRGNRKA